MEAPHPLLQPAVVGVHVVDMEIWRLRLRRAGCGQDMELDPGASSEGGNRRTPIAAQFRWLGDDLPERGRDAGGVEPRQDGIDGRAGAIAGDDDWDLLRRQTPLGGFAGPLARCSRQIAAFALEGFEDEGLVRLDDPGQAQRLVEIERGQEPMSPPERGGVGHLAAFRGLRDRLAGDQRLRLVRPAIPVMQAGQRRPGQRVECLPATRAADQAKLAFLQRFRRFDNGTPSHDQLGNILANLDPVAFQRCFVAWAAALTKTSAEVIAIDGKTVRRSYQKKGAEEPIHVVSAFAARQRMVLGQTKVGDKSNEIVAIPALLELLAIEGAVVTIDAAGCQRKIAQTIIDKKADYILALKGNQGTLRDDVELFAKEQKAVAFRNTSVSQDTTVDGDHGRIETRTVTVFHDIGWLQDSHQWPGLKSVVMVESERETHGKAETETRFYITSLTLLANAVGPMIRSHWMVENGLHWVLDMIFRDDECRVRTDNAPFNLAIVKHIALNVLRTGKAKDSLRMRRKVAAWDENALAAYIAA